MGLMLIRQSKILRVYQKDGKNQKPLKILNNSSENWQLYNSESPQKDLKFRVAFIF